MYSALRKKPPMCSFLSDNMTNFFGGIFYSKRTIQENKFWSGLSYTYNKVAGKKETKETNNNTTQTERFLIQRESLPHEAWSGLVIFRSQWLVSTVVRRFVHAGDDHVLIDKCRECTANEGSDPVDPMVVPSPSH